MRGSLKREVARAFPQSSTFDHHIENVTLIKRFQNDDNGIAFYTGFLNFETLLACFDLFGDKAKNIIYEKFDRKQFNTSVLESPGASRLLSLLDEIFLVLVRLELDC